jgi:hypothetical protein
MRVIGNVFLSVVAAFAALPARTVAQAAGTARPVAPVPARRFVFTVDDVPAGIFVVFGGASVGSGLPGADPSTVNTVQMDRTLKDVLGLNVPVTSYLSLGGLVSNGVADGGKTMASRFGLWQSFYEARTKSPIRYVIGPEGLGPDGLPDPGATTTWLGLTPNRPPSSDYSYTQGRDRMVFLDTQRPAGVNVTWLSAELETAKREKTIDRVLVFGWRPMAAPAEVKLDAKADAFLRSDATAKARQLLVANPKVAAYFCGSPSLFSITALERDAKVKQVVVGNGGGPLDPGWKADQGRCYGFTLLITYGSGRVTVVPFHRAPPPEDQPFYTAKPVAPSAALGNNEIVLWERPKP